MAAFRDALGAPLALGERVLLAWLPRQKGQAGTTGWRGRCVFGRITATHISDPPLNMAVLDDEGVTTVPPSSCVLRRNSETFRALDDLGGINE